MKKIFLSIWFVVSFCSIVMAQNIGNEWINYNQSYYQFNLHKDGVYRITYSDLVNAGVQILNINPQDIQIYARGEQVPIYITNEATGIFSSNDYIEFYGEMNDAWLDEKLFSDPSHMLQKDKSILTDTASCFLTWTSTGPHLRLQTVTVNNYSSFTEANYFVYHTHKEYSAEYFIGVTTDVNYEANGDPRYLEGEGFFEVALSIGDASMVKTLNTKSIYGSGPQPKLEIDVIGASDYAGAGIDHHLRISFLNKTFDEYFSGYEVKRFAYTLNSTDLSSTSTPFAFDIINDIPGNGSDRVLLSEIRLEYPHTSDLDGASEMKMDVPDGNSGYAYYNFTNFTSGSSPILYDIQNGKRIIPTLNGSNLQVLIPNSGALKSCHLVGQNKILSVNNIKSVGTNAKFTNYLSLFSNADYIIITHPMFLQSSSPFATAYDYAQYRASTGYNTMVVNVEDLYSQYAYGIVKHPLAIRHFIQDIKQDFNHEVKALLLIGKGLKHSKTRTVSTFYSQNLVPTFGSPGSDVLLTAGLVDSLWQPYIPTGRISADSPEDLDIYLSKIQEYEAIAVTTKQNPEVWQKRMLHFRGGKNAAEHDKFDLYLAGYESIIEDTLFGAQIEKVVKTTSIAIQSNLTDEIIEKIDNGASFITFLGHAASLGFDISLDDPSEYNNKGKYPMMIALSCYTGDIFVPNTTTERNISEKFVLIRDKGFIAYLASATPAFPDPLNVYSTELHKQMAYKNYGKPVGLQIKETIKNVQSNVPLIRETCLEMTLHGDPMLTLYHFDEPDYSVTSTSVYTTPSKVTSELDSFDLNIVIANLGKATPDTFFMHIKRIFPDPNTYEDTVVLIQSLSNTDTIRLRYRIDPINDIGSNTFEIKLDEYNVVDEIDDFTNNNLNYNLLIQSADVIPVYPPEFAIVGESVVKLKCSSVYPFASEQEYYFELDTTKFFNSPSLMQDVVKSSGGVIEWIPQSAFVNDQVYYWRVRLDSTINHQINWRSSSFHYILNEHGWSQSHFYQFEKDEYQFVKYKENIRGFKFINDLNVISARAGFSPPMTLYDIGFEVNNQSVMDNTCLYENWAWEVGGLQFVLFDTLTAYPLFEVGTGGSSPQMLGSYNNVICNSSWTHYYEFATQTFLGDADSVWFQRMADFIGQIPDKTPVLVMSRNNVNAPNFPEYLYKAFDSIGAFHMRNLPSNASIAFLGRKNVLNSAHPKIELNPNVVHLKDSLVTNWSSGSITSPVIGPSKKWSSLHWNQHAFNGQETDSVHLELIGIKADGTEVTVINALPKDSNVIIQLNSILDASIYPYARMVLHMRDDSMRTAAQLDSWQLRFAPVGEIAIDPKSHYAFYKDTIMEGDTIQLQLGYRNLSDVNMDSVLIKYWIIDQDRNSRNVVYKRTRPLPKDQLLVDTIEMPTFGLKGECYLWMDVNPINPSTSEYDQRELTHVNNVSQVPFLVNNDKSNPLIDITFDGVRILDGDIVSAQPEILISLKDENQFLAMTDTSLFRVYLTTPENYAEKRIYFVKGGVEVLEFVEAQLPENKAKVIYRPEFLLDGEYSMRIQAKDASQNASGQDSYELTFQIINKSTITEVLNWPNPFSDKTHFVFTLTGSELPSYMKIQIMTVTGKVVREIDMDELGPLHIGRNITEYAWNGTDQFGDRLANGVYLYRVVTRMNDQEIELNSTEASKYFVKDFGKMYLVR